MNTQNIITQDFPSANEVDHSSPQTPQAGSKTGGWEPTPGPWYPVLNTAGMWDVKINDNPFGHSVATVSLGCPEYFRGDQEANARLIAAAPDMLEALKLTAALFAHLNRDGCTHDTWAWITQVRETLAKATGKDAA